MSDFLVNLARRSAGLAPVVRARSAPVTAPDDARAPDVEPRVSPGAAGTDVRLPVAAPGPLPSSMPRVAPVSLPVPIARVTPQGSVHLAQRAPATGSAPTAVPAPAPTRAPGETPVVAPHVTSRPPADAAAAIVPASTAIASAAPASSDRPPRTHERAAEPPAVAPRVDTVAVWPEPSDTSTPVVVKIEPVERPAAAIASPRAEPLPERTVHVRIGAIEIVGADGSAPQPTVAASPAAVAPAVAPTSPPSGFDDFAALRSYTPWAW